MIVNMNEAPSLLRNDVGGNANWIKVKLEGVKSNRSAIGARVLVSYGGKTQAQAVVSQSSFFPVTTLDCISALEALILQTSKCIGRADYTKSSKTSVPISY